MWSNIFIWSFLSFGITTIVVDGKIFVPVHDFFNKLSLKENLFGRIGRFMSKLISCNLCFSTWVGFFLGYFIYSPTGESFLPNPNISWVFDGFFSAGVIWLITNIVGFFEENRIK